VKYLFLRIEGDLVDWPFVGGGGVGEWRGGGTTDSYEFAETLREFENSLEQLGEADQNIRNRFVQLVTESRKAVISLERGTVERNNWEKELNTKLRSILENNEFNDQTATNLSDLLTRLREETRNTT
jgi:hypothetical protein